MKEKIDILLKTLGSAFAGAPMQYKHETGRHTIFVTLPDVVHRLDFLENVVASKDAGHLKRLCKQVAAHVQRHPDGKPKHVLIQADGIHEGF